MLKENQLQRAYNTIWTMRHVGTEDAVLCSGKQELREFSLLPGHAEAMTVGLRDIVDKRGDKFFSMYRTIDNGRLAFNGAIEWSLPKGGSVFAVSWRNKLDDGSEVFVKIKAIFGLAGRKPGGSVPPQDKLRARFMEFNEDESRREQFKLIRDIWTEIWGTCGRAYGGPGYTIEVKELYFNIKLQGEAQAVMRIVKLLYYYDYGYVTPD